MMTILMVSFLVLMVPIFVVNFFMMPVFMVLSMFPMWV
jgi:hypothetical protein